MFPSYKIGTNSLSTRNERSKRALLHHGYHLVKAATRRWSVFPCGTASLAQVSTIIGPCPLQVRSVKFDVYLDCPHTQAQTRPPRNLAGVLHLDSKFAFGVPFQQIVPSRHNPQHTHTHTHSNRKQLKSKWANSRRSGTADTSGPTASQAKRRQIKRTGPQNQKQTTNSSEGKNLFNRTTSIPSPGFILAWSPA